MPRYLTLTGSVVADRQSEVAANVAGRVTATTSSAARPVKAGQVLAVVDSKAAGFRPPPPSRSPSGRDPGRARAAGCDRADSSSARGHRQGRVRALKTQCTAQLFHGQRGPGQRRPRRQAGRRHHHPRAVRRHHRRALRQRGRVRAAADQGRLASTPSTRCACSISVPEPRSAQVQRARRSTCAWRLADRSFPAMVRYVSPALRAQTRDLIVEASPTNNDGALRPACSPPCCSDRRRRAAHRARATPSRVEGTVKRLFLAKTARPRDGGAHRRREGRPHRRARAARRRRRKVIVKPPPGLRDGSPIQ